MAKTSITEITTLLSRGAGVKISATDYSPSELTTLASKLERDGFLIIKNASATTCSAMSLAIQRAKGRIILDFT